MIRTLLFLLFATCAMAQAIGSSESRGGLTQYESFSATVPAGSLTTVQTLSVNGSGENFIHLVASSPLAVVSLVTPTGQIVTSASAAQLGFGFEVPRADDISDSDWPIMSVGGTHLFITIPIGKPSGLYQLRVDSTNSNGPVAIIGTYFPHSRIGSAAVVSHPVVSIGSAVQITGLLFEDGTPVTANSVTGTINMVKNVPTSQVNITCAPAPPTPGFDERNFTCSANNLGSTTLPDVYAEAVSGPPGVQFTSAMVVFGDIASGSSTTSPNIFSFVAGQGQSVDLAMIQWEIKSLDAGSSIALTDASSSNPTIGDGIYPLSLAPATASSPSTSPPALSPAPIPSPSVLPPAATYAPPTRL